MKFPEMCRFSNLGTPHLAIARSDDFGSVFKSSLR